MKLKIIYPSGEIVERKSALQAGDNPYEAIKVELYEFFQDANFEHVTVMVDGERRDMFVDEMDHPKDLAFNLEATLIYHTISNGGIKPEFPLPAPPIVGLAVLYSERMWF